LPPFSCFSRYGRWSARKCGQFLLIARSLFFMDFIFYQLCVSASCACVLVRSCRGVVSATPSPPVIAVTIIGSSALLLFYCNAAFICDWGALINWQLCSCGCFMALNGSEDIKDSSIGSKLSSSVFYVIHFLLGCKISKKNCIKYHKRILKTFIKWEIILNKLRIYIVHREYCIWNIYIEWNILGRINKPSKIFL